MIDWVEKVFVGLGIKGGEIDVINFFNVLDYVIEFNGVGVFVKECVLGFEFGEEFEGFDELVYGVVFLFEFFLFVFLYDDCVVVFSE